MIIGPREVARLLRQLLTTILGTKKRFVTPDRPQ